MGRARTGHGHAKVVLLVGLFRAFGSGHVDKCSWRGVGSFRGPAFSREAERVYLRRVDCYRFHSTSMMNAGTEGCGRGPYGGT